MTLNPCVTVVVSVVVVVVVYTVYSPYMKVSAINVQPIIQDLFL